MNKIYLATGTTDNYYSKAEDFIKTMNLLSDKVIKVVITLGFNVDDKEKQKYPNVMFVYQDINPVKHELTYIRCLQHGAFMDAMDSFVDDDDIIIFSDGDVIIQRDISDEEIQLLESFTDNDIGCNLNNYNAQTIKDDFSLLTPHIPFEELQAHFSDIDLTTSLAYNTGNVVAKPKAWRKMRELYVKDVDFIRKSCLHYAQQQLLMNIITNRDFNYINMPQTFHTHGHFGLPPFATYEDSMLKVGPEIVLFRHYL